MKKLIQLIFAVLVMLPQAGWARNAEIMMLPTRVVMEDADRASTVTIKNTGDETGHVNIELVDMKMEESGAVVPYAAGEVPQFSAIPYLSIAPHNVTLAPGQSQNVRLALHKPENMEAGEYRAHLKVRLAEAETGDAPATSGKTSLVIIIPVIVRNGPTTLTVGIDQPKLEKNKSGDPVVDMYLTRQGNRSAMGNISVTCLEKGRRAVIKNFPGVAVYRPAPRRFVSVPLDETPKDVDLSACTLEVAYLAPQKDGGKALAEARVAP